MRFLLAGSLVSLTLILTACGLTEGGSERPGAASLVPADAVVYGEVTLDPDGDQADAVRDIAARFPGGEDFPAVIEEELTQELEEEGVSYSEDIEPLLGDQAVFFLTEVKEEDAEGALIVETDDEEGARETFDRLTRDEEDLRERDYEGTEVVSDDEGAFAVLDGNILVGTPPAVEAAIDTSGGEDSIEDSEEATEALERFDDPLAAVYLDGEGLVDSLGPAAAAAAGPLVKVLEEPYALAITAESDAVVLDATVPPAVAQLTFPLVFGAGSGGLDELPAGSFVAGGQPELGNAIESLLDLVPEAQVGVAEDQLREQTGLDLREDVLAWMGDLTFFARGTSLADLGGGAAVATDDPEAAGRALDTLREVAQEETSASEEVVPLEIDGAEGGFTLTTPEAPEPIHFALGDDRVVIAYGDEAAQDLLEPSETLADDEDFTAAADRLGDDFSVGSYVDVQAALELAENLGASSDSDYQEAKPYLEPFVRVVGGTKEDGDTVVSRTRIELR